MVGALRQRGVPAGNRIGFAHYFTPGWAGDHVIVEFCRQGRWQRADPELGLDFTFDVHDILADEDAPFETRRRRGLGSAPAAATHPPTDSRPAPPLPGRTSSVIT